MFFRHKTLLLLVPLALVAIPRSAYGWGAMANPVNPLGVYGYTGPAATGYGGYKYGYGDYSDRYGYRPDSPGNANTTPVYPTTSYGFRPVTAPPTVYPKTTLGGYRTPSVAEALMPGVFR